MRSITRPASESATCRSRSTSSCSQGIVGSMRMKALAFAIVAAASSLGGVAFAESKNETISDAEAQRYMAFFDQVVTTVSGAKTDCPKMSADLGKLFDTNAKIIDDANKAKDQGKK